jgi:hypothetical protein
MNFAYDVVHLNPYFIKIVCQCNRDDVFDIYVALRFYAQG